MIQLTHPQDNYELWVDPSEIVVMERYVRPPTTILMMDETPPVTALVMKNGRVISCKETPSEIFLIMKGKL